MKKSNLFMKSLLMSSMVIAPMAFAGGQMHNNTTMKTGTNSEKPMMDETSRTTESSTMVEMDGRQVAMPSAIIKNVEEKLSRRGYTINKIDGVMDIETEAALKKFQTEQDLKITSKLNKETLEELDVDYKDAISNSKNRDSFAE